MALSRHEAETLIDLVENKLSDMPIWDGDDRKTVVTLENCLIELNTMKDASHTAGQFRRNLDISITSSPTH